MKLLHRALIGLGAVFATAGLSGDRNEPERKAALEGVDSVIAALPQKVIRLNKTAGAVIALSPTQERCVDLKRANMDVRVAVTLIETHITLAEFKAGGATPETLSMANSLRIMQRTEATIDPLVNECSRLFP